MGRSRVYLQRHRRDNSTITNGGRNYSDCICVGEFASLGSASNLDSRSNRGSAA